MTDKLQAYAQADVEATEAFYQSLEEVTEPVEPDGMLIVFYKSDPEHEVIYPFKHMKNHSIRFDCLFIVQERQSIVIPLTSIESYRIVFNSPENVKAREHEHQYGMLCNNCGSPLT